jgi:hypothetical protein
MLPLAALAGSPERRFFSCRSVSVAEASDSTTTESVVITSRARMPAVMRVIRHLVALVPPTIIPRRLARFRGPSGSPHAVRCALPLVTRTEDDHPIGDQSTLSIQEA